MIYYNSGAVPTIGTIPTKTNGISTIDADLGLQYDPNDSKTAHLKGVSHSGQLKPYHYEMELLRIAQEDAVFTQLGDRYVIPNHAGKTMKQNVLFAIISDENVNLQGIDSDGNTGSTSNNPDGNLWGSSKSISVVKKRLPVIGEEGGEVNRVGISRGDVTATAEDFGIYFTYTKDSLTHDSIKGLLGYVVQEMGTAVGKVYEAQVQIRLLESPGIIFYAGTATSKASMDSTSIISNKALRLLDKILTHHKCPMDTKLISGSTKVDTRVVNAARMAFYGPDVKMTLEDMKTSASAGGKDVWTDVAQYAAGGPTAKNEKGKIGSFRFVEVPNMMYEVQAETAADATVDPVGVAEAKGLLHTSGANDVASANRAGHTGAAMKQARYHLFPILVVGSGSFSQTSLEMTKTGGKFTIHIKPPTSLIAIKNPYPKAGLVSMEWTAGVLIKRPERIAVLWTVSQG